MQEVTSRSMVITTRHSIDDSQADDLFEQTEFTQIRRWISRNLSFHTASRPFRWHQAAWTDSLLESVKSSTDDLINQQDPNSFTPLHLAVWNGHVDTVEALLEMGADVSLKTNDGLAPMDMSPTHEISKMLKVQGAKKTRGWSPDEISAKKSREQSAGYTY